MHIIPLNIGDLSQATERCKPVHLGIFVRLLMEYYKSENALPNVIEDLEWVAGVENKSDREALMLVLRRFFVVDEGRNVLIQRRVERELIQYRANGVQKRYAILCRWWEKVNPSVKCPTLEEFTESPNMYYDETTRRVRVFQSRNTPVSKLNNEIATASPQLNYDTVTSNQKPVNSNQNTPIVPKGTHTAEPSDEAIAEAIYALYPKKVGHGAAIKSILKALKISGLTELEMQGRVRSYAEAVKLWPEQDKTYVPMPSTWFNQQRYMDDPAEWSRTKPVEPQTRFSEKKEKGEGPAQTPEAPEPDWDWRSLHAEIWGASPSCRWLELPKSTRFELRQAYLNEEKKGKGGAADV